MITEKKLKANRINSRKGGEVTKQKFAQEYETSPTYCRNCEEKLVQSKRRNIFCSQSCAASHNNRKYRGKPKPLCIQCGQETKTTKNKFCSNQCSAIFRRVTDEAKRTTNAVAQAKYRAKYGYLRAYDPNADKQKIKEIYMNCPDGCEVDHIIPLSKGGKHHENNLQYLTIVENRSKGNKIFRD